MSRNFTKVHSLLLPSVFLLISLIQKSFCAFIWESFGTCDASETCLYKTDQEKLIAYAKGFPDIKSKDYDEDFLNCHELVFSCGYVLKNSKNQTFASTGVRIGTGVDLGRLTAETLMAMQLDQNLISKLFPYLGLKGEAALLKLKADRNLSLTTNEAFELNKKVTKKYFNAWLVFIIT